MTGQTSVRMPPADIPKVMMILETAIASLTARAEHAERIADQERQRAASAETQIAAERQARQDADARAAAAERDSQAAQAEAMRLREAERGTPHTWRAGPAPGGVAERIGPITAKTCDLPIRVVRLCVGRQKRGLQRATRLMREPWSDLVL